MVPSALLQSMRAGLDRFSGLDATVEWSLAALSPWERSTLVQCSIFRGGFTRAAAAAIVDLGAFPEAPGVGTLIDQLCDKSLLYATPLADGGERLGIFGAVREHASRLLEQTGQLDEAVRRHAQYYLAQGVRWAAGARGHSGADFRGLISAEQDNLLAIHQRALETVPASSAHASRALVAALVLDPVLAVRGPPGLQLSLLDTALELGGVTGAHPVLVARAHHARANLWRDFGELARALEEINRAIDLASKLGDEHLEAIGVAYRGTFRIDQGQYEQARADLEASLRVFEARGDRRFQAFAMGNLGVLAVEEGRLDDALAFLLHSTCGGDCSMEQAVRGR